METDKKLTGWQDEEVIQSIIKAKQAFREYQRNLPFEEKVRISLKLAERRKWLRSVAKFDGMPQEPPASNPTQP